ncbi:hypothetical protein [Oceanithermus sp.]|uniref:hypothetical protein n=1 Tax=Oceanithermus sp. TaxID=2268145 RepID=UPI00257F2F77|nr:hypothetical protein [Oceanithermus sp.]
MPRSCPACFEGQIPVELAVPPYTAYLDCPYCRGRGLLDPEDPDDARLLDELSRLNLEDPDVQTRITQLAQARARILERETAADGRPQELRRRGRRGGGDETGSSRRSSPRSTPSPVR